MLNWPFAVDEMDDSFPGPGIWEPFGTGDVGGITAYLLRKGTPMLLSRADWQELIDRGEIALIGSPGVDWLGAPLRADGRIVGAIVVQSYRDDVHHTEQDKDILTFVASHIGAALSRARAIEETRQRNAELALITDVQRGLAENLEMQAMYDLVGDRLVEIFDAQVVDIGILDREAGAAPLPVRDRARRSIPGRANRARRQGISRSRARDARAALGQRDGRRAAWSSWGSRPSSMGSGETGEVGAVRPARSSAVRRRARISLQNLDHEHAFSDAEVRLLTTLAGSLSVALENARLFEETRQRNAELALINEVQRGLAENLEMQAMYDLVGDHLQEIFDAQVVDIGDPRPGGRAPPLPVLDRTGRRVPGRANCAIRAGSSARHRNARTAPDQRATWMRSLAELEITSQPHRLWRGREVVRCSCRSWSSGVATGRHLAPEPRPRTRVHRGGRSAAHDDRGEPERRARERSPVRGDRGSGTPSSR